MKTPALIALLGLASLVLLPACEKHSAEVTAAKYLKEKDAKKDADSEAKPADKKDENPPTYFKN